MTADLDFINRRFRINWRTQTQLAYYLGRSPKWVGQVLSDPHRLGCVNLETALALADALSEDGEDTWSVLQHMYAGAAYV